MLTAVLTLLLALPLGPPFGDAEAAAIRSTESTLILEVRVQVLGGAEVVVVQPYGSDRRPLEPLPLSPLGDGWWGALIEVPRRSDIRLGFEILDVAKERSEVHTLVELGVDPAVFSEPAPDPPPTLAAAPASPNTTAWLVVAAVAAALSIALLVVWWRLHQEPAPAGADEGRDAEDVAASIPHRDSDRSE